MTRQISNSAATDNDRDIKTVIRELTESIQFRNAPKRQRNQLSTDWKTPATKTRTEIDRKKTSTADTTPVT